jgi:hypothetical protein
LIKKFCTVKTSFSVLETQIRYPCSKTISRHPLARVICNLSGLS